MCPDGAWLEEVAPSLWNYFLLALLFLVVMVSGGGGGPVSLKPSGSGDPAGSSVCVGSSFGALSCRLPMALVHGRPSSPAARRLLAAGLATFPFKDAVVAGVSTASRRVDRAPFSFDDRWCGSIQDQRNPGCVPGRWTTSVCFIYCGSTPKPSCDGILLF
jgi:hypothetical protein